MRVTFVDLIQVVSIYVWWMWVFDHMGQGMTLAIHANVITLGVVLQTFLFKLIEDELKKHRLKQL